MEKRIVSFVNVNGDTWKTPNEDELLYMITACRKNSTPLEYIDLSAWKEIRNIDFGGLTINNVIFNVFDGCKEDRKVLFGLSFKGSKLSCVSFAQCRLVRSNFDQDRITVKEQQKAQEDTQEEIIKEDVNETELNSNDFFLCEFELCRFRNTRINKADFRYSRFNDCSLGGIKVSLGDFYMAAFCGTTSFNNSCFKHCSLTNATFEHHCIRFASIEKLVQECYEDYSKQIISDKTWRHQNPCADFSHQNVAEDKGQTTASMAEVHREASEVYAQLSGFYAGKGFNQDSNLAYEMAIRNEAIMNKYLFKNKELSKWVYFQKWARFNLYKMFGFGYKLNNVLWLFLVLIVGYGIVFLFSDGSEDAIAKNGWSSVLAYSLNNSLSPYELFTHIVNDVLASFETIAGILLIGFMGYVIANRIRNNY